MAGDQHTYAHRLRKLTAIVLCCTALLLAGCFESKQEYTVNPDGSGKVILQAVFDPSALSLGQGGKDPSQEMVSSVKKIIEKSEGIDVWKDVVYSRTADGQVSFKGTGYFKDLSKVRIQNFGTDFTLTREGNLLTVAMTEKDEGKPPAAATGKQPTDAEIVAQIKKAKADWERSKPMMQAMVAGLKKEATLKLPGKVVESNNFVKVSDNTVSVSIEGAKMIESLDQLMADEEWLKQQARSGALAQSGGGPPAMDESFNEKFFGQPGPVMAKVQAGSKPWFDYKKETAAALKAYPKLQESLGMVSKLPAGTVLKDGLRFEVGEVRDTRTTGEFFGGLEVELVMTGNILTMARGIRKIQVQKAVDDTGRELLKEDSGNDTGSRFDSSSGDEGKLKQKLELKNPARTAAAIQEISGTVVLYVPGKDPKAAKVVVKGFMKQTGKPVVSDLLKKGKIELAVLTKAQYEAAKQAQEEGAAPAPKDPLTAMLSAFTDMFSGFMSVDDNDLVFMIKDPGSRVVDVEVVDAAGKAIETRGRSSTGGMQVISFEQLPPDTSQLAIYLETTASMVQAPFKLTDVPLP